MNRKRFHLSFPIQILTTGIIVIALAWVAARSSNTVDSKAFDVAAAQTWHQFESTVQEIVPIDDADTH